MTSEIIDLAFAPLRLATRLVQHEVPNPLEETEHDLLHAVNAIHRATASIEHHVEVIEGLATSVGPLTESVNNLTATMKDLVTLLAPMAAAEHGVRNAERQVQRAERFLGFHRHKTLTRADGEDAAE
jgi:uncharacterized protein YoxC